jgi:hypothetical protein
MASAWVEHVKDYAKRKGLSYGCALSDPKCSKEYKTGKALAGMKKVMGSLTAKQLHGRKKKNVVKLEL